MSILTRIAAAAALATAPAIAAAAPVTGGDTTVRLTADLAALGLTVGVSGSAQLLDAGTAGERVLFPITGGTLDPVTLAGDIQHEGSGLTLTGGATTVGIGNFVIDTVNSVLLGDVTVNGLGLADDVPLFSFDLSSVTPAQLTDTANPALALNLTSTAAQALTVAFGAPDLTGAQIGLAATAPTLGAGGVPEPAGWTLAIAGFGLVGAGLRRRRLSPAAA